jgi:hypothetical protein
MCWIDGLQIHTNQSATPWMGGRGAPHVLRPEDGLKIHGFYGTRGNSYVGRLGAYCSAIAVPCQPVAHPSSTTTLLRHHGVARGVIITMFETSELQSVVSFDSHECLHQHVQTLEPFLAVGAQLHVMLLEPGEFFLQIDVSVRHASANPVVEGICLHTTTRCSSWFGSYIDTSLRFAVAPRGHIIHSVSSMVDAMAILNVKGEMSVRPHTVVAMPLITSAWVRDHLGGRVAMDAGAYDVRVRAQSSSLALQSLVIIKRDVKGENLDHAAYTWTSHLAHPHLWCVAARMLEYHAQVNQESLSSADNRRLAVTQRVIVGGIDQGGAVGSSAASD